ncbi:MAG: preprotein translocase subunit SecA [Verrucomicrobia bacterium]|nr:preprotein translocase subunit SecA [Verrucomicrobiota bacterium]MCG2680517.1 preprotein translocase subunit SecA [Kiritimatiellia bacterium]MBU4248240.1 preprotein translocase subunit SecA [Verrucomicrobiota bacterium]MBU4290443.1 preprotein translocase subunit SecA [Verrucomicrobiota bacterium]MBU4428857.1 preprotein translocase subunit SecA [Verrucomicrobiota bacterium]
MPIRWILNKIVGTKHHRDLKKLWPLVAQINALEKEYQALSEDALKAKTSEFKARIARGAALDSLLGEAFAVVKNTCRRLLGTKFTVCEHEMTWDMVPFDVQLIGGIALHQGKIAEMATGEGKTLVATMPLYLNALTGKNVHLVTVNDYLARRDSQWMGLVYQYLGLTVGCIQNQMVPEERRAEYAKDITYGTNSEFGFDYLRDNGMAFTPEDVVQREHAYAIIDEVDSILIDEARTPLIISGPAPVSSNQYAEVTPLVDRLFRKQRDLCNQLIQEAKECIDQGDIEKAKLRLYQVRHGMPKNKQLLHILEDTSVRKMLEQVQNAMLTDIRKEQARALREEMYFTIDERGHDATLTEKGCSTMSPSDPNAYVIPDLVSQLAEIDGDASLSNQEKLERRQNLQNAFAEKSERIHNVDQLIRAYSLYEKDVEYVVQNNQVLIVDEFTGRILPGRRWSDGLHQAIEAKEGVKIERETQTLATITIQNYFRLYKKLAGMTGTAETEANEFRDIYKLDVVVIPTNRPIRRVDNNDLIYRTRREKYKAVIDEIGECHRAGQPVLVGTVSVETSELISRMLKRDGIPHNVLNAKNHEREAEIVMRAGQPGAVTIATNMAGRGTDIKLGLGVVYLPKEVVESKLVLDQPYEGKSLRARLREKPCGLHVIGSERHESRRIDRQLRGRCARQGDPGSSRFYVSLEDDLMRLFGSDRISGIMAKMGIEEGQQLEHPWLNRSIGTAQQRVEQHNYSIRKRTLEYDDVMNKQREIIYGFRGDIVRSASVREHLIDIVADMIETRAQDALDDDESREAFLAWVNSTFPIGLRPDDIQGEDLDDAKLGTLVFDRVKQAYDLKVQIEDAKALPGMERYILLHSIDTLWQDYLRSIDHLRQGVGLRAYGQQDPLVEYKREAYAMFSTLMDNIKAEVVMKIFRSTTSLKAFEHLISNLPRRLVHNQVSALSDASIQALGAGGSPGGQGGAAPDAMGAPERRRDGPKVGRNDPCPCGSGKKFKKCCGAN